MQPLRILHIDDNDDDALLLARAVRHAPHPTVLKWLPSATEAVRYLEGAEEHDSPDLIFCDLRMPGMNGHEFVRWLRASSFRKVPVVVLSSSDLMGDIKAAYQLGANSFLTKPMDVSEIWNMVHNAVAFWSQCVLPANDPHVSCPVA